MNLALVQNASGPYVPLLELSLPIHRRYCERHNIAYLPSFGRTTERNPNWDRWPLLLGALEHQSIKAFDAVVWLDADCLIVDDSVSLKDCAIKCGSIGMVRHTKISWKDWGWHYNAGVMVLHNNRVTRQFLEDVWSVGEVANPHQWKNQAAIHTVLDEQGRQRATTIDDRWNCSPTANPCEQPVVMGYHGKGAIEAFNCMRSTLFNVFLIKTLKPFGFDHVRVV